MALADHFLWSTPGSSCSGLLTSAQDNCNDHSFAAFQESRVAVESSGPVSML
jgi:hypothetical protein